MNKVRMTLTCLGALVLTIAFATAAQAVTFRSHVSISGSDANTATNCSRPNPCRNFAAAYSVTSAGGEIVALDSGGFGGLTITTAVTVMAIPGQTAFTAVTAGTNGITVSAGANDLVTLRNITFGGSGAANTTGVRHNSGKLVIKDCLFQQLTIGVDNYAKMDLIDCDLHGNSKALQSTGTGTYLPGDISVAQLRVRAGNITGNTVGTHQVNPGVNGNQNPLANILVFSWPGATLNLVGNGTNSTCSGAACQSTLGTYTMGSNLQ